MNNDYYYENKALIAPKLKKYREEKWFSGLREEVLERDHHTCTVCGKPGNIVHHEDGEGRGSENPNNSLDNLFTMCRSCHCIKHKPRLGTGKKE
jgi:5-methylcytosine-specific restriction endonuclease McrA